MHNIKDIRIDIDNFKNTIKNRNVDVDFDQILNLDEENRKLIQEKEKLEIALSNDANLSLTKTNLDPVVFVARSKSSMPKFSPSS